MLGRSRRIAGRDARQGLPRPCCGEMQEGFSLRRRVDGSTLQSSYPTSLGTMTGLDDPDIY